MKTPDASARIDARIEELGDWRGPVFAKLRKLIHAAVPGVQEDWKWRGTPTFEHDGILCTGETYKEYVKLTFPKGASLPDPKKLFNASLAGNARRAIDVHEGDKLDEHAFTALIKAAAAANAPKAAKAAKAPKAAKAAKTAKPNPTAKRGAKATPAKKRRAK